ncbi:MAG: hypothetical protein WCO53_14805 [Deltaproteobacteria bacterium]
MNVIFYSSKSDEGSKTISKGLENSCRDFGVELHHSKGSLESRLRQPLHGIALMLLYLSKKNDLDEMITLQELIIGLPVILITNETAGETMIKARLLQPRFIFAADDNLEDMCLVFEKMLDRKSSDEQQQSKISA